MMFAKSGKDLAFLVLSIATPILGMIVDNQKNEKNVDQIAKQVMVELKKQGVIDEIAKSVYDKVRD